MILADLHIHSPYSIATSKRMTLPVIASTAHTKGISLLGTGDFTCSVWLSYLKDTLKRSSYDGIYVYDNVFFVLSSEVALFFRRGKKAYKVHLCVYAPNFETAEEINKEFASFGKLETIGRPMISMDIDTYLDTMARISNRIKIIPAHIWTPWYSLFGARSGFKELNEIWPNRLPENICAFETGLSSDPAMNGMVSALDGVSLVSNSDAHCPDAVGREANVLANMLDYDSLFDAIKRQDRSVFLKTIEYPPILGKYYLDGHRRCCYSALPHISKTQNICPRCNKNVNVGVLHTILAVSDRSADEAAQARMIPFVYAYPLKGILRHILKGKLCGAYVDMIYKRLVDIVPEMFIWLEEEESIKEFIYRLLIDDDIAERLINLICSIKVQDIEFEAGYDGRYGRIIEFGL